MCNRGDKKEIKKQKKSKKQDDYKRKGEEKRDRRKPYWEFTVTLTLRIQNVTVYI